VRYVHVGLNKLDLHVWYRSWLIVNSISDKTSLEIHVTIRSEFFAVMENYNEGESATSIEIELSVPRK